jgi:hypothetical protein
LEPLLCTMTSINPGMHSRVKMFFLGSSAEQVEAGTAEEVAATRFDRITASAREMVMHAQEGISGN